MLHLAIKVLPRAGCRSRSCTSTLGHNFDEVLRAPATNLVAEHGCASVVAKV